MREIKFRAWSKEQMWREVEILRSGIKIWRGGYGGAFQPQEYELMQYTGLKENAFEDVSKNKEIYESDIIEFIGGERLVVEWNDDTCQWQYSDGSPLNSGERYATHKMIVGNIYQNPELLNP